MTFKFVLIVAGLCVAGVPQAPPTWKTTAPVERELVVEHVYAFSVATFEPPVVVDSAADRGKATFDSPEECFVTRIAAMRAGDVELFERTWTASALAANADRDKQAGRTPDFWRKAWASALGGTVVELTHKVQTGAYVILGYRITDKATGKLKLEESMTFEPANGKWLATQALSDDPVRVNWRGKENRLRRIVRPRDGQ